MTWVGQVGPCKRISRWCLTPKLWVLKPHRAWTLSETAAYKTERPSRATAEKSVHPSEPVQHPKNKKRIATRGRCAYNGDMDIGVESTEYVPVFVRRVLKETRKAILVDFAMDVEAWIPKSQIHDDDKNLYWRGLTNREISIKEWLALELELL